MPKKPIQFIIIDDDAINNMFCRYSIIKHFPTAKVQTFVKPKEGLSYIAETYPTGEESQTILFLDIKMPQMSGWEFLDEFAELPPQIRQQFVIFILSSSSQSADQDQAEIHPLVSGYVRKPLTNEVMQRLFDPLLK